MLLNFQRLPTAALELAGHHLVARIGQEDATQLLDPGFQHGGVRSPAQVRHEQDVGNVIFFQEDIDGRMAAQVAHVDVLLGAARRANLVDQLLHQGVIVEPEDQLDGRLH